LKKFATFFHSIPCKIWVSSIVLILIPLLVDIYYIHHFKIVHLSEITHYVIEMIWFLYIFPPVMFAFYFGLKGALISSFALQVIHSYRELLEHVTESFPPGEIYFILIQLILGIFVSFTIGLLADKLKQKQTALELAYKNIEKMAYYDSLTGLPNRRLFQEQLNKELSRHKENNAEFALLFLDLDGFKQINDTLGHEVGDLLLQEAGLRLTSSIRETDLLSRLAGDEFVVLLPEVSHSETIRVTQRLLNVLQPIFMIDENIVKVTASIGIAIYKNGGETADTMIKYADIAMYQAKKKGKNNFQFYTGNREEFYLFKQ
jgi:diguanylate cyclase (GGDEF)-like protein